MLSGVSMQDKADRDQLSVGSQHPAAVPPQTLTRATGPLTWGWLAVVGRGVVVAGDAGENLRRGLLQLYRNLEYEAVCRQEISADWVIGIHREGR